MVPYGTSFTIIGVQHTQCHFAFENVCWYIENSHVKIKVFINMLILLTSMTKKIQNTYSQEPWIIFILGDKQYGIMKTILTWSSSQS